MVCLAADIVLILVLFLSFNVFLFYQKKKESKQFICGFDKEKLIRLAKFYLSDFSMTDILALGFQLQNYIFDTHSNHYKKKKKKKKKTPRVSQRF